jgi:hypothetical protein
MRKFIIVFICLCAALNSNAQTYLDHVQQKQVGQGTVTVTESKEIDDLVNGTTDAAAVKEGNKSDNAVKTREKTGGTSITVHESDNDDPSMVDTSPKGIRNGYKVNGYRIQVFQGGNTRDDRSKAQQVGNNVKALFPDQPVYVHFYSPRWTCRMGNFRTYEEAHSVLQSLRSSGFPQATILKGKITVQY